MRRIFNTIVQYYLLLGLFFVFGVERVFSQTQNVGIGTTTPDNSAILDLVANDRGFLVPRLTTAQRNAISSPATGLLIYNVDNQRFEYYDGTQWVGVMSSVANVPFNLISSGTNTTATMTVGLGANIVLGGGNIESNVFKGTGSTTDAVDLATSEIAGVLPIANGGTGSSAIPTNGQLLIGNGSGFQLNNLNPGTGITITNGAGTITIADANATSEVTGAGNNGQVAFWTSTQTLSGDNNLWWDNSNQRLGVGTSSPAERLDVAGNIQFSGALMPNGSAGTNGQVLVSQGSGNSPQWTNASSIESDPIWTAAQNTGPTTVSANWNFTGSLQQNGNDVLTTATSFNGDVSGVYNNLQLGTGVVGTTEIADGTIVDADINNSANIAVGKLAAGSNNQVLATIAGTPTWTNASSIESDPIWTAAQNTGPTTVVANWNFTGSLQQNGNDVLTTTTGFGNAGGSDATVSGTYNALDIQLGTGVVGTTEIADGTIVDADINNSANIAVGKLSVTQNNLIVGDASNQGSLLTPGSNGQVLKITAGAPSWGSLTASEVNAWSLSGNALTGTEVLGSTNNQPVTFVVNNTQALRLNTNGSVQRDTGGNTRGNNAVDLQKTRSSATQVASGGHSVIAGGLYNTASGIVSAVAGGSSNTASEWYSAVAGGYNNTASDTASTVAGGFSNTASGDFSAIAGGYTNTASGYASAIGGGYQDTASGYASAIAGGFNNTASGNYSVIAGGYGNTASGNYSFAVGLNNQAYGNQSVAMGSYARTHNGGGTNYNGSFAFGDASTTSYVQPEANNQFVARFAGGYRFYSNSAMDAGVEVTNGGNSWSSISDSTKKADFLPADGEDFLSKLSTMRLGSWRYKWDEPTQRRYGPFAQEFFARFGKDAFGIIGCDTLLATADVDGVIFILLQALEARTSELRNAKVKMEGRIEELENENADIRNKNAELLRRIEQLERIVKGLTSK